MSSPSIATTPMKELPPGFKTRNGIEQKKKEREREPNAHPCFCRSKLVCKAYGSQGLLYTFSKSWGKKIQKKKKKKVGTNSMNESTSSVEGFNSEAMEAINSANVMDFDSESMSATSSESEASADVTASMNGTVEGKKAVLDEVGEGNKAVLDEVEESSHLVDGEWPMARTRIVHPEDDSEMSASRKDGWSEDGLVDEGGPLAPARIVNPGEESEVSLQGKRPHHHQQQQQEDEEEDEEEEDIACEEQGNEDYAGGALSFSSPPPLAPRSFPSSSKDEDEAEEQKPPLAFAADDDDFSTDASECMIRINTQTDLCVDSPLAFLSTAKKAEPRTPTPHKTPAARNMGPKNLAGATPASNRPYNDNPPAKNVPTASLRLQHSDAWLNQWVLPRSSDERKASKLEAVGSFKNLHGGTVTDEKAITALRFSVEQTALGVDALELELETQLRQAKFMLPEADFLKVLARVLNLKKQALAACVQAVERANSVPPK